MERACFCLRRAMVISTIVGGGGEQWARERRDCSTLPNGTRAEPVTTEGAAGSRDQPNIRAQGTTGVDGLTRPTASQEYSADGSLVPSRWTAAQQCKGLTSGIPVGKYGSCVMVTLLHSTWKPASSSMRPLHLQGCDRSIPKTCAVDHLCQCWRFAYLIDMRVKSNGWGANDFQPSRWEEMSYQVNVKHASRHTTKMRIPQALDF